MILGKRAEFNFWFRSIFKVLDNSGGVEMQTFQSDYGGRKLLNT
jgi:hypothetical protein